MHAELKSEFLEIERALDELGGRMRAFRAVHGIILAGRVHLRSDGLLNAQQLENEWREMCQVRDRLIVRRNVILEQWAVANGMRLPANV